jgi:hypothetical protein
VRHIHCTVAVKIGGDSKKMLGLHWRPFHLTRPLDRTIGYLKKPKKFSCLKQKKIENVVDGVATSGNL